MSIREKLILSPKIKEIRFIDKDLYNLTKLVYSPLTGLFYRKRYDMITEFLGSNYDAILEIGFGPGIFVPTLAKRCRRLYGVDVHQDISKVSTVLRKSVSNFIPLWGDLRCMPVKNNSFDVIICQSVLEHIEDLKAAFEEMERVIKDDGIIILGFPLKNIVTKSLFALIGYNDSDIHPSSHSDILNHALSSFTLKAQHYYPVWLSDLGLYYTGVFKKKQ
ncbi:MAG: class I SAM-dependent methyltransferase [Candidatus Omnitrophica bacterium]|nr:class I SAM-dependent methyltransferase [Candidatus Omnitrophota bacterium]